MVRWLAESLTRTNETWYRRRFVVAVACLLALALGSGLTARGGWPLGQTMRIEAPRMDERHAYVAELARPDVSADKEPLDSRLYEISIDRGLPAFARLNEQWGWSLTYLHLRARVLAKHPDYSTERRQLIGPGNQQHEDVRELGAGRYSVWHGRLYFSASDNSSPLTNGRRYELFVPFVKARTLTALVTLLRWLSLTALALTLLRAAGEHARLRTLWANTAPGLLVSIAMLVTTVGAVEIYQRVVNKDFLDRPWPMRFEPVAGLVFQPHAEVRWSNHLDFWTRERTNSLGFLDHEPEMPKPAGRFRVLLVGDSFVEAAQVTNREKLQSHLAAMLGTRLGEGRADVAAIGLSGTGQANQLAFYEAFGRRLSPDLVVLVAVSNDFANNSPLLSAVRYGWNPSRPPWFYFDRDERGFRRIEPVEDWARFKLPGVDPVAFHAALIQNPRAAARLAGWDGPAAVDMDTMFWRRNLPPAFQEAIALTRYALEQWKAVAARDRFRLVVAGTANLTRGETDELSEGTLYLRRFRETVEQVGLPFVDFQPYLARQPDRTAAVWRHDAHWTGTGHRWAADALFEYLTAGGFLPASGPTVARK